jgi:hypothetical protein
MQDAIIERIRGVSGEFFALTAANVPLPEMPELPRPAPSLDFKWWASENEEWYSVGPCATREEAIAEARSRYGADVRLYVVEGAPQALQPPTAEEVILAYLEGSAQDGFDAEHRECDREGGTDQVKAADEELQELLNGWHSRWRHTFSTPNLFAQIRSEEVIEPELAA